MIEEKAYSPRTGISIGDTSFGRPRPKYVDDAPKAFGEVGWVNAAISAIAEAAGSVDWRIELRQSDGLYAALEHGPLVDILEHPNDFCSAFELREGIAGWMMGHGNSFIELAANRVGKVSEMWLLDPRRVRIVPDRENFIRGYLLSVEGMGKEIPLEPQNVIHLKLFNLLDPYYAISPLVSIIRALEANVAADDLNMRFFLNDATPGGVLQSQKEQMSREQREMLAEAWAQAHRGRKNKFKPAVLWGGLEWKQVTPTHTDMAFVELDKRTQDKILGVLGVSNAEVGDWRDLTFATALMQDRGFWTKTMIPILRRVEQVMSRQLLPHFAPALGVDLEHDRKAARIRFDLSKVKALSMVSTEQAEIHQIYVKNRILSPNEVREEIGRDPYEGGEQVMGPISEIPIGEIKAAVVEAIGELFGGDGAAPRGDGAASAAAPSLPPAGDVQKLLPSLGSKDRRDLIWKSFDSLLRSNERMVRRALREFFKRQHDRIQGKLRAWASKGHRAGADVDTKQSVEDLTVELIFDTVEEAQAFAQAMSSPMTEVATEFGNAALAGLGIDEAYDIASDNLQTFLERRLTLMAKRTQDSTFEKLTRLLKESIDEGETVAQLSARLKETYAQFDKVRSLRIARTETGSAANFGLIDGYEQSEVVVGKEWLSSRDAHVRDSHQIDGQVVALGDKFVLGSGATCEYPLDPNLPAEESVNCRCGTAPVIDEDALKARGGVLHPLYLTTRDVPHLKAA